MARRIPSEGSIPALYNAISRTAEHSAVKWYLNRFPAAHARLPAELLEFKTVGTTDTEPHRPLTNTHPLDGPFLGYRPAIW